MTNIQQIYDITQQLDQILSSSITAQNRQAVLDEAETVLDEREKLIQQLAGPYTEEEKRLANSFFSIDERVQQKMKLLLDDLKKEMKISKKKKSSNQKYLNPYKNVATYDGTFLDKKK
ncbi:flagellar protein FliT [Gracilibacillus salinarum]|uniref:Flagellar protein FliT n=1 Tax=Gracilibacillus salinarum TaxID=2932255 RepID=A0ABY4GPA5_9BACI|nr:flagellar protein FliT [Gracilibacillus salinarum]UOQ85177.1 flagellar protein FliT [Gracilibacillus salinarum]